LTGELLKIVGNYIKEITQEVLHLFFIDNESVLKAITKIVESKISKLVEEKSSFLKTLDQVTMFEIENQLLFKPTSSTGTIPFNKSLHQNSWDSTTTSRKLEVLGDSHMEKNRFNESTSFEVNFQDILIYEKYFKNSVNKLCSSWKKVVPNTILCFFVENFLSSFEEQVREEFFDWRSYTRKLGGQKRI